jgi:Zn-dependent peptidase ImmA (M78 family)
VYTAGLDNGVSGILIKRADQDAEIYLQLSDSENRQRFTCAHELGHYVGRTATGEEAWEYVEHRALLASQGTNPEERFANRFAASLLMPRDALELVKDMGVAALAYRFRVSADAMNYRL